MAVISGSAEGAVNSSGYGDGLGSCYGDGGLGSCYGYGYGLYGYGSGDGSGSGETVKRLCDKTDKRHD